MENKQTAPARGAKKIGNPLDNNKFCFALSLVLAVVIWVAVSVYASPQTTRTVQNVKVMIDMSAESNPVRLGMEIFGESEYTVDVTVTGKKYLVSESVLTADDIIVTASTSYVTDSGKNTLRLRAALASENSDISIISLSSETISVFFDYKKEAQQTIEADVRYADDTVPEDIVLDSPILSQTTVTMTGPATNINKVARVVARVSAAEVADQTTVYDAELLALNSYGDEVEYITFNAESVTVTVPVIRIATFRTAVTFGHSPLKYRSSPLTIVIKPSRVTVEVPVSDSQIELSAVSVGTIDFNELDAGVNTFTFDASEMDYAVTDGTESFEVTVDLSGFSKRTVSDLSLASASIIGAPEGKTVAFAGATLGPVTVVGPQASVAALDASGLYAELDLTGVELKNGANTVPVRVYAKEINDCWAYGTYEVTINVSS
ncbi:MAG: hypothetical protein K6C36_09390 [Clostridia bacterium]|nr:hypothetical protein [Clostridia bacterium]